MVFGGLQRTSSCQECVEDLWCEAGWLAGATTVQPWQLWWSLLPSTGARMKPFLQPHELALADSVRCTAWRLGCVARCAGVLPLHAIGCIGCPCPLLQSAGWWPCPCCEGNPQAAHSNATKPQQHSQCMPIIANTPIYVYTYVHVLWLPLCL